MEDSLSGAKIVMGAKSPQEALSLQASMIRPSAEKALAYSRSVYEISVQTQEELSQLVESQFGDFQRTVASLLEQAAKTAPAGSGAAVGAVQSAFAAANSAFGSMSKTVKQIAEMTKTNINADAADAAKTVGKKAAK